MVFVEINVVLLLWALQNQKRRWLCFDDVLKPEGGKVGIPLQVAKSTPFESFSIDILTVAILLINRDGSRDLESFFLQGN